MLSGCQQESVSPVKKAERLNPALTAEEAKFTQLYLQHLQKVHEETGIPGIGVSVVYQGKTLISDGIGHTSIKTKQKVNRQTVFRLGSVSKGFGALLVARMIDRGLLDWDTKVVDILPEFRLADSRQSKRITISHLLSHSTGLPYHTYTNLIEAGLPITKIMEDLYQVRLLGPEGQLCAYQNAAFTILEPILEKLTGKNIQELYQEELFTPGSMCDASVTYTGITNQTNHALPHRNSGSRAYYQRKISNKYYNSISSGGINASPADMTHYMHTLLGNHEEFISHAALDSLFRPFVITPGSRYFDKWADDKSSYGMGWRILDYHGQRLAYHGGFVNNYRTEIALDLDRKLGICLLFNGNIRYAKNAIPTAINLWESIIEGEGLTGMQGLHIDPPG